MEEIAQAATSEVVTASTDTSTGGEGGAAAPNAQISITIKLDDVAAGAPETFTLVVKRGAGKDAEVLETYDGITPSQTDIVDTFRDSKYIAVDLETAHTIMDSLHKQKLLKAMAVRHAQISEEFAALVVAPVKRLSAVPSDGVVKKTDMIAAAVGADKLRVFASVKDKNLGMRLAIMNRKQRQRFWMELKAENRKRARAKARKA